MSKCRSRNFGRCSAFYLCILLLIGCGAKNNNGDPNKNVNDAAAVRDDVLKSLRSSRIPDQLRFGREAIDNGLLNDVDRTNHYLKAGNKGAAAANLGVYMSDLSTLITHGKRNEANRYFQACLTLSEFIGMKKQFSQAIHLGFNDIIEGDEKLEKSLAVLFEDATNTAEQEEFKKLHASALTGYYIEELYLLASYLKFYRSTDGPDSVFFLVFRTFATQKDELNNLITYFDHVQLTSAGISAYQHLLSLQAAYFEMDSDRLLDTFDVLFSLRKQIIDF
jgi:hypothetical protein